MLAASLIARVTKGKLEMEIILNATLAGGVAMGSAADTINRASGSMLIGFISGAISALGFAYIGPFLKNKIGLHDTCGVHNLHGMPGILGGIISIISCCMGAINFGDRFNGQFIEGANGRTAAGQAWY